MKKRYKIDVDCANCAAKMEVAAQQVEGVKNASINFMTQKLTVEFSDGADISSVMTKVKSECEKIDDESHVYC
jgi:cation transport ATPase